MKEKDLRNAFGKRYAVITKNHLVEWSTFPQSQKSAELKVDYNEYNADIISNANTYIFFNMPMGESQHQFRVYNIIMQYMTLYLYLYIYHYTTSMA